MYVRSRGLDMRVLYCVGLKFVRIRYTPILFEYPKQKGYVKREDEKAKVSKEDKGQIQPRRGGGKRQTAKGQAAFHVVQIAARVN